MMQLLRRSRRRAFLASASGAILILLLGGSALAFVRATPDHSPFTMTITEWNAALGSESPGTLVSGTIVTRLEYRSVRDWTTTTVSHSLDSRYVGSTHTVKDDSRSFVDALTRQVFGRTAAGEVSEVPDRWLIPNLTQELPKRGFTASPGSPGTLLFTNRESVKVVSREGQSTTRQVLTNAVFDANSGLPISIEELVDGMLRTSTTYVVVSRP